MRLDKDERDALIKALSSVVARYFAETIKPIEGAIQEMRNAQAAAPKEGPPGRDGIDGKSVEMEAVVSEVLARIPTPKDGRDAEPIDVKDIVARVIAEMPQPVPAELETAVMAEADINAIADRVLQRLPPQAKMTDELISAIAHTAAAMIPRPKDGLPGRDAEAPKIEDIVAKVLDQIRMPEDGKPGKDAEPVDIAAIVDQVLDRIPEPDLAGLMQDVVSRIPQPKDGAPGKDAAPVDIAAIVDQVLARIPTPKDGQPGKDAEPINLETVVAMVLAKIPPPRDGRDGQPGKDVRGEPGRDALQIDILNAIDPARSYPRGTFARHQGGLIRAFKETTPGDDLLSSGWEVIVAGVASLQASISEDFRTVTIMLTTTGGAVQATAFNVPALIYRGTFNPETQYDLGDTVTYGGSLWIRQAAEGKQVPMENVANTGWKLAVKEGRRGKDGKDGKEGPPGKEGRPGRDLTQIAFNGEKY